jgi:RNA polymerase sigma-70 factor (ECF subfamily)
MTGGSLERQLVDAVLAGDDEAFRILVERESANVIGLCQRMLGDRYEAEDVAQEAFLRAYRSLPTYRGDGPFGAWVWRIAMRLAVARLKQRRPDLQADPSRAAGWLVDLDRTADPVGSLLGEEQRRQVADAISTLPDAQRQVVSLRFFADHSLEQIASETGAPIGTVKSRLHRGLLSLRRRLGSAR